MPDELPDEHLQDLGSRVAEAVAAAGASPDGLGLWRALGTAGVPAAIGAPPDLRRLARFVAVLDAAYPPGPVLSACVQVATVLPVLAEAERRPADPGATWAAEIRALCSAGTAILALAVTDAESPGSELTALGCAVQANGGGIVLHGGKRWITNATVATHALVLARRRPGSHFTDFSWVLVPTSAPGVTVEAAGTPLFAGAGLGQLWFDGVCLPASCVVGGAGRGLASFTRHVATERLCGALWAAALTRRVLAATRERLAGRNVGGQPLAEHPVTRQRLGRALVAHAQLVAVCRGAVEAGEVDPVTAMVAKVTAAQAADRVLTECAALSGADGFATDGQHLLRAEVAMLGTAGGTTELMLSGLADRIADLLDTGVLAGVAGVAVAG